MRNGYRTAGVIVAAIFAVAVVPVVHGAISDALVVHLTLDNTYADSSGQGNNGTNVGATTFVAGQMGQSVKVSNAKNGSFFNYVTLGAPSALNFGLYTDFSFSFWAKANSWAGDPAFISNKNWASGGNQGHVTATDNDGRLQWNFAGPPSGRKDYDGSGGTFGAGGVGDGLWHHVAVTFSRSGAAISYIDGVEVDARDINVDFNDVSTPAGLATNIGQDGTGGYTDGGGVEWTDCDMDDVGIWRRVISASEVTAIYQAGLASNNLSTVIAPTEPPVIAVQPATQSVVAGSDVVLFVNATGGSPFTYAWSKGASPIAGATNAFLILTNVQAAAAGSYTVVVSNSVASLPSDAAVVTIDATQAPTIPVPPLNVTANPGANATFNVVARGVEPLGYQWRKGTSPISGATLPSLTLTNVSESSAGLYNVVVTAANSQSATSTDATLLIITGITNQLVVHLTFDGNVNDTSGRGNNGSSVGSTPFTAGQIGQAVNVSTTNDGSGLIANYVTLGLAPDLVFVPDTTDFSIAFWTKLHTWANDPSFIANKDWDSGSNLGYVLATDGDGRLQWNYKEADTARVDYDGPGGTFGAGGVGDGKWHSVITVFQRGGLALTYVDGALVDSRALPTPTSNIDAGFPTNIGQDGAGDYAPPIDADIDDLGIWRRALTRDEVTEIYQKGKLGIDFTGKSIVDRLVVHLPFDSDYKDFSGHGNNGTAVGAPSIASGQVGAGSLSFSSKADGTSFNYVTLGVPGDLNFGDSTDFSVSLWINFTNWAGDPPFIANKDWDSGGNQGWVIATAGDGRLQWNIADGDAGGRTRFDYDGPAGTISNGQWHNVVVTFDRGTNAVTYLDGVPASTNAIAPGLGSVDTPAGLATNVGQDGAGDYTDGNSVGIVGRIDDVGIWRRVLEPSEVTDIYTKGQAGQSFVPVPQPVIIQISGISVANNNVTINWTGGVGTRLQQVGAVPSSSWLDVSGTDGASTVTLPLGPTNSFFRLIKP